MRRPRWIYVALGLLTLCAVFAATAGVREALATNTQALRQTLSSSPSPATAITVSAAADSVSRAMTEAQLPADLTEDQIGAITGQLHADYDHGIVSLAPRSADWASLTSNMSTVASPLPKTGSTEVKLEVTYRQPLSQHMRLVAGHFPGVPAPPGPVPGAGSGGSPTYTQLLQVVVTQQTATTFGLRVGSKVRVPSGLLGGLALVTLQVSGIVVPTDPDSEFWTADLAAAAPSLQNQGSFAPPPFWVGGVIAGPGEASAMQGDFGSGDLTMEWGLPLTFGSITGQQAQPLKDALTSITAQTPALSGDVAPAGNTMLAACSLLTVLAAYFTTAQSVQALLWLLYVSLTVTGLTVLLVAARMVALRRSPELTMVRARGGSLWQVGLMAGGAAAAVCIPAAVIGIGLAVVAVPGAGSLAAESAGGWWPPAAVLAFAVCGPALIAAWQHRLPRHRGVRARRQPRARVRLVVEVTLVAAAVAGIVVFRKQGTVPGAGVNLYTSAAPLLVAVPAVIVAARIYPFVLRGLLRASTRSAGAPAFLGLARATRNSLTPALPAFALVLALTVAAFAGMVRDAVINGDTAASWKAAGADVTISGQSGFPGFAMPPSAVRALSAVPGVTHAAQAWSSPWLSADGTQLTVLAVDPASYAALVAAVPGAPAVAAGSLAAASPGAPQPVLASPSAAASLGAGATSISTLAAVHPVRVRVAGVVWATPGWPGGGAFLIMPLSVLKSTATPPTAIPITELLLTGAAIDRARLTTMLHRVLPPGGTAFFRTDVLSGLTNQPLQHGASVEFTLSVGLAAVLGLAVMFLELALGGAERESTLARLATMGLGQRQRARVVALEVLPAVIAAAVTAWACALALPQVVGPAIDLSVFTNTTVLVPLAPAISSFSGAVPLAPDVASVVLPLAGLIVLACAALWIEIRLGRRRGVTTALRIGG